MLGFHPEHNGFVIDPCIPKDWKRVTGMRRFRGDVYEIEIINESGSCKGVRQLWLDGAEVASNKLPLMGDGKEHTIRVIL
jgi:cellobiose phosphorylase